MIPILLLVIITFLTPKVGSIIYVSVIFFLDIWILLANFSKIKFKNDENKYTTEEVNVIERFHLFFRFPTVSPMLSRVFAAIQLSVFILVPWLLFKGFYMQVVIITINYFIAGQFAVTLNPKFYLHDNLDKNKIKDSDIKLRYIDDMQVIDSALQKMYVDKPVSSS